MAETVYGGLTRGLIEANARTGLGSHAGPTGNAVLAFHAVGEDESAGYVDGVSTERFRRIVRTLSETRRLVPLTEITDVGDDQAVALTFDDGLKSVFSAALPVLREFDVPATVFLNPRFVGDRDRSLLRRRHAIRTDERIGLTDDEVCELADDPLISLGNHTLTHPDLSRIDDPATLHEEIVESREVLADRYGVDATAFCYPYGETSPRAREIVEESHALSVTSSPFLVERDAGLHHLPRVNGAFDPARLEWELTPASDRLHRLRRQVTKRSNGPAGTDTSA